MCGLDPEEVSKRVSQSSPRNQTFRPESHFRYLQMSKERFDSLISMVCFSFNKIQKEKEKKL